MQLKNLRVLIFTVPFCFLLGIAWGVKKLNKLKSDGDFKESISLLMEDNYLPQQVVEDFQNEYNIKVNIKKVSNAYDLIRETLNSSQKFDLVQTYSYNAKILKNSSYDAPISDKQIENYAEIAADFKNLSTELTGTFAPINWDIFVLLSKTPSAEVDAAEFRKMIVEKEQKILLLPYPEAIYFFAKATGFVLDEWIEYGQIDRLKNATSKLLSHAELVHLNSNLEQFNYIQSTLNNSPRYLDRGYKYYFSGIKFPLFLTGFRIHKNSSNLEASYLFLNYLYTRETALKLALLTKRASVVETLNKSEIEDALKPKKLRSLPLSHIFVPEEHFGYEAHWLDTLKTLNKTNQNLDLNQASTASNLENSKKEN